MIASSSQIVLPNFDDLARAQRLVEIEQEHEELKEGLAEWIKLVRAFVAHCENECYDSHGFKLLESSEFEALKESVSE